MHPSRNGGRRKPSTSESTYPSSRFEDAEDDRVVSHLDDSSTFHDTHMHKSSRNRYKSRSRERRHEPSIHDEYHENRNRRQEDDWRPAEDRNRYYRDHYRSTSSYEYDSSINNWSTRPLSDSSRQSDRRSTQRDWREQSGSGYSHDIQRHPDQQTWDDNYDPRNDSFDRWTPAPKEGSDRSRYEFERDRDDQRPKDVHWVVDDWRPPGDEFEWSGEHNDKERSWISREDSRDRTWKPASSWQQSQGGDSSSQRRRYPQKNTQVRKGWQERNHSKNKERNDLIQENRYNRPLVLSPSPSPPPLSLPYRSSHRSRSRSKTPKRRRIEVDHFDRRDPSPRRNSYRRDPRHLRSPASPPPKKFGDDFRPRSLSLSVSRSPSPESKPAARHRLPLVSHAGQAIDHRNPRDRKRSPPATRAPNIPPLPTADLHWHPTGASSSNESRDDNVPLDQPKPNTKILPSVKNSLFRNIDLDPSHDDDAPHQNSSEAVFIKSSHESVVTTSHKNTKPISFRFHQGDSTLKRFFPEEESNTQSPSLETNRFILEPQYSTSGVKDSNHSNGNVETSRGDFGVLEAEQSEIYQSRKLTLDSASGDPEVDDETERQMSLSPSATLPSNEHGDPQSESNDRTRMELFQIVSQVGEGTFGKVYKARNSASGIFVALKKIRMEGERDGFPVTAMREIKLLQSLQHVNVIRLHEMMVSHGHAHMVFEYMDHDLTGILGQTQFVFSSAHLKSLCRQMLSGLSYLHQKGVIHRDIKGSNILVNNRGELKLGDFGLARFYHKRRRADYTNRVITLWYRPPELLLGGTVYGPEVDMWSAGCIMLELFTKKPVFQGNDEIHQLDVLYKILGTPTPNDWPGVSKMPWYELVKPPQVLKNRFREFFHKWLSPAGVELAQSLLLYDPERRITAADALQVPYFHAEEPGEELPVGLSNLDGEWHEYEHKRERARRKRAEGQDRPYG